MRGRKWLYRIDDMIENALNAMNYSKGMDEEDFLSDGLRRNAIYHVIQHVGEAANHIPPEAREKMTDIPWVRIIATRNVMVHGYAKVDPLLIWDVVQNYLPKLVENLNIHKQTIGQDP